MDKILRRLRMTSDAQAQDDKCAQAQDDSGRSNEVTSLAREKPPRRSATPLEEWKFPITT